METKSIQTTRVYYRTFRTTLKDMAKYIKWVVDEMREELDNKGIEITAPPIWQYRGADGNPDTEFDLDICLVANGEGEGFMDLEPCECLAAIHNGAWDKLSATYGVLMNEINNKSLATPTVCREIYHTIDFENIDNNVTEVLMVLN